MVSTDYTAKRVLIVDDEEMVRRVCARILRDGFDCSVEEAGDGEHALERIRASHYDVIITDMLMPGLHGTGLVRQISQNAPDTAVIVSTGYPGQFPYVDVVAAGADDFVAKPFYPGELHGKVLRSFREQDLRAALVAAERKYRRLFEMSMDGLVLLAYPSLSILDVNEAFCEAAGQPSEDLCGRHFTDFLAGLEVERVTQGLAFFRQGGRGALCDIILKGDGGRSVSLDISVSFLDKSDNGAVLLSCRDVTDSRQVAQQLEQAAQTDDLTGLANRRAFRIRAEWAAVRARTEAFPVTLLMVDIDNFKACNDTLGHQAGDRVLVRMAQIIRNCIRRGGDEGFRFGGDEFAALLTGAAADVGLRTAERMRADFLEWPDRHGTTLSIGVAELCPGMTVDQLVAEADAALYRVKELGKDGISGGKPAESSS